MKSARFDASIQMDLKRMLVLNWFVFPSVHQFIQQPQGLVITLERPTSDVYNVNNLFFL